MDIHKNILSAENIIKRYISGTERLDVLRGATLKLEEGDMAVLIGASGAGKSTLLHILGTLDKPESGRVLYKGVDIVKLNGKQLAKFRNAKVGFVHQFHHLLPEFSALENVMMPGLIGGLSKREAREKAQRLLADVGLGDRSDHFPGQLSGGEAQRVAVARALLNDPEVVYADEPTGNLDRKAGVLLLELFARLNKELRQTFLIATHNMQIAERMKKRFIIEEGRISDISANELPA